MKEWKVIMFSHKCYPIPAKRAKPFQSSGHSEPQASTTSITGLTVQRTARHHDEVNNCVRAHDDCPPTTERAKQRSHKSRCIGAKADLLEICCGCADQRSRPQWMMISSACPLLCNVAENLNQGSNLRKKWVNSVVSSGPVLARKDCQSGFEARIGCPRILDRRWKG
jgi:hypothetical protein